MHWNVEHSRSNFPSSVFRAGERAGERRAELASYLAEQVRQRFELTVTL